VDQRPCKNYTSNFKSYFPAAYREIKFSQKVLAVIAAQIFNIEKETERAQSEAVRNEGMSILQFSKQM